MTTDNKAGALEVTPTQADRDASADLLGGAAPEGLRSGERDSLSLVQALAKHRQSAHADLIAENERYREALEWYANKANWVDTPPWEGDPDCITPNAIPMAPAEGDNIAYCDCGDIARAALSNRGQNNGA